MNMQPTLQMLQPKKLVGRHMKMSLADNRTGELWKSFMQRRKEITNAVGTDLYSMQLFDPGYFSAFDPGREFTKWAATEVKDFEAVPESMEAFTLPGGLYAVFQYKGPSTNTRILEYIFGSWLPGSGYALDNRPHFEVLGEKYKGADPASEEEIWIPVRPEE